MFHELPSSVMLSQKTGKLDKFKVIKTALEHLTVPTQQLTI